MVSSKYFERDYPKCCLKMKKKLMDFIDPERNSKLYTDLHMYPNMDVKKLSKKIGWSVRKINRHAKRLMKSGLITKVYMCKKVGELINFEEMKNTRREDFDFGK